jgi:hypothetical protein
MQHHVYFWIKEEYKNAESFGALENALDALCKTPNITSGGWGKSAATPVRPVTDKSFDYAVYLTFDSVEKHDAYQVHPEHHVFVKNCKHFWETVRIMDVE